MKSEVRIQSEIVMWFNNNYCLKTSDPQCAIFSVPNEAIQKMGWKQIGQFKATGLKSGVSDLIVLLPEKTLFVEVKTPTGSMSKAQKEFCDVVDNLGFNYYLVRSLEQFKEIIESEFAKSEN